jgi:hypothetical protein
MTHQTHDRLKTALGGRRSQNIVGDFWHLLRSTGKWWLAPVIMALLMCAAFLLLGGTAAAPFIYTLF